MVIRKFSKTIFVTPIISSVLGFLSLAIMTLIGWRIEGDRPVHKKYILLAAPHTSNWDFPLIIMVAFRLKLDVHWMGKSTLFPFPVRAIMFWLGGIPIDRSQASNVVDQMVDQFNVRENLIVLVPPEGTRSKVDRWKSGFYHIAAQAKVPIVLGFVDAGAKQIGFGPDFFPTDNIENDMEKMKLFYKQKIGIIPENQ
ncbi:MAG: 1-acyl-sn-glycerol-3-phosphate acyltransferase [Oceanicoccus sp.]|jgi:1-acyl-sn-glycerol-3-phosphate acyltransferase